jgi:hypothetical protein
MSPEEFTRRKNGKLCLRCGKGGHSSIQCLAPAPNPHGPSSSPTNV